MSQHDKNGERSFAICKDHHDADWNQPELENESCVLCRLFYLEAQEQLLEEWQQRAKRAEATIEEIQRPLDAQMARLNATVARLNGENERLKSAASAERATEETYDASTIKGAASELERAKIHGPDVRTVDALDDAVRLAQAGERYKILLQATQQAYVRDHEALSAASAIRPSEAELLLRDLAKTTRFPAPEWMDDLSTRARTILG